MSSVTRFLRQIPTGLTYVNPDSLTSSALDFVPTAGNYVGNYPPGYMVSAAATGLQTALSNAKQVAGGQFLVRDMGKTIFAPFNSATGDMGYFREYQLLVVSPIGATQGFLGGVGGNNFGVVGPANATAPGTSTYCTFYLPVAVGGVGTPASALPVVNAQAGGQM